MFNAAADCINHAKWDFVILWLYLPWTVYVVNRVMDEKSSVLKRSWLPYFITVGTFCIIVAYLCT